jgi:STE24 endopeptidase
MRLRVCTVLLLATFTAFAPGSLRAQAPASSPTATNSAAMPVTEYTLPPDKLAKAKALYDVRGKFRVLGPLYYLFLLWVLLRFGIAARLRDIAERTHRLRVVQAAVFVPLLLLVLAFLELPVSMYQHHVSVSYGLSVQGWASWFTDYSKAFGVNLFVYFLVLWGVTNFIRMSPRRWWFYAWLAAAPLVVFAFFITPLLIDPLFNKFEPLAATNPQLVDALERVMHAGGVDVPRDRMFLMKASAKTTTLNAYVTGFGASKRVVVWDTTVQKLPTPELLFLFGHEMGHYVLHHVRTGMLLTIAGLLLGLYVLYRIANWMFARFHERWHMRALSDWAAVPLLLLVFYVLNYVSLPISNAISRQIEHNADIYGLEVTHDINANAPQVAARSFQVLGELSLEYPYTSKFVEFWYYDHPTIGDRVRFASQYDPWSKGAKPKYVK